MQEVFLQINFFDRMRVTKTIVTSHYQFSSRNDTSGSQILFQQENCQELLKIYQIYLSKCYHILLF